MSSSVQDLTVTAAGVDGKDWEGTYTKPIGGILTVHSELGEPIHKVGTRGVKLWKEFDDTVFNLPKEKSQAWLVEHKQDVIEKLNCDFSKPLPNVQQPSNRQVGHRIQQMGLQFLSIRVSNSKTGLFCF